MRRGKAYVKPRLLLARPHAAMFGLVRGWQRAGSLRTNSFGVRLLRFGSAPFAGATIQYSVRALMNLRSIAACALVVVFGLGAGLTPATADARPSRKQLREAETNAKLAKEYFRDKRYEEAADLFMKVYRLSKKVTAVFNAARCKEMATRYGEARSLFELYLSISDNEAGKEDAREHLVDIAARLEQKRKAEEAKRAAAVERAKKAALDQVNAEKAMLEAQAAREVAEKRALELENKSKANAAAVAAAAATKAATAKVAAAKAKPRKLGGLVVLPPSGVHGGELAIAATASLQVVTAQAVLARLGKVRSVATYNRAESSRGVGGACDFPCRLGVARALGARWAIATSVKERGATFEMQSVLWRTVDMAQDGVIKAKGRTPKELQWAYRQVVGDLFNKIRVLPVAAIRLARPMVAARGAPSPAIVEVVTQPYGAQMWLDGKKIAKSPGTLRLRAGWHRLQFSLAGYRHRGGLFYVERAKGYRVTVALPRLVKPKIASAPRVAAQPRRRRSPKTSGRRATSRTTTHPSPAGSRARGSAGGRSSAATNQPRRRSSAKSQIVREVATPGVGWLWGMVIHITGGIGVFEERSAGSEGGADISLGGGGFFHFGYASDGLPHIPWFSLVGGVKFNAWQGFYHDGSSSVSPNGPELFYGLILPRMWGVMLSGHRAWVGNDLSLDLHGYNSVGIGVARTSDFLFWRFAFEKRTSSDRSVGLDAFGQGPTGRLLVEGGFKFGGAQFNR